jgi:hypothetical protein
MGNFYTQILVCGSAQESCAKAMTELGRRSIVLRPHKGIVPVCDLGTEAQDIEALDSLAYTLSNMLCVPTVAILNHDDDTLIFRVFGPEGFKGYCLSGMLSGGAYRHLKEACSAPCNLLTLWFAFFRPHLFEVFRHQKLIRILDLPPYSLAVGYEHLSKDDFDELIPECERVKT